MEDSSIAVLASKLLRKQGKNSQVCATSPLQYLLLFYACMITTCILYITLEFQFQMAALSFLAATISF